VVEGLPVYLLEAEKPSAFFWRGQFYREVWFVYSDVLCMTVITCAYVVTMCIVILQWG
jgi:hypothetical protein